jgi:hypothetical protein
MISRRGGYRTLGLSELVAVDSQFLDGIMGNWGLAYGVDLGMHARFPISSTLVLGAGASWLDVGDTSFGPGPDPQRNNLGVGTALTWTEGVARISVLYDLHHLTQEADIRKKNHLGLEIGLPALSIYAGLNQLRYLSYGVGFDLWLFSITALSTTEELGTFVGQQPNSRYSLRADLKIKI